MRHWTMEQLSSRYEALNGQRSELLRSRPAEETRQIEKYRSLAAIELCLANVLDAAFVVGHSTHLEIKAFLLARDHHRREAEHWRARAEEVAALPSMRLAFAASRRDDLGS